MATCPYCGFPMKNEVCTNPYCKYQKRKNERKLRKANIDELKTYECPICKKKFKIGYILDDGITIICPHCYYTKGKDIEDEKIDGL